MLPNLLAAHHNPSTATLPPPSHLALRVVEVGGHCDDGFADGAVLAQVLLRGLPHLGEDHGGDLLRGKHLLLALELD